MLASTLCLTACDQEKKSHDQNQPASTIITVKPQSQTIDLYYKGTMAPISLYYITSPVSGHIAKMGFTYGDPIKKGQLIANISADNLADTYGKQLSDYISKKDTMESSENDYTSAMSLYDAGVETQNNVTTARSAYNNSVLSLNTSKHALEKTASLLGIDIQSVESLSLNDVARVTQELNKQFKSITVISKYDGVALHPLSSDAQNSNGSDSTNNNSITVGSDIKENQLLLSVGDLNGYSTQFNVNEVDIHHFKIGQKVLITGPAFPNITLQGQISQVATQANTSGSGSDSMAEFAILATIPNITKEQSGKIDVGMSAKIDIPIITKPEISVPMDALSIENGKTVVHVMNQNNQIMIQPVTVGTTMISTATIIKGLHSGDRVVVPNH